MYIDSAGRDCNSIYYALPVSSTQDF
jgi:hypothetical protein